MSNECRLKEHVQSICKGLEDPSSIDTEWSEGEPSAYEYLQDALDIQYLVTSKGNYIGARVLVAFGGPNIWINTFNKTVEGHWWGEGVTLSYSEDALGLDEVLESLCMLTRA